MAPPDAAASLAGFSDRLLEADPRALIRTIESVDL
jgi:hypothetical protein